MSKSVNGAPDWAFLVFQSSPPSISSKQSRVDQLQEQIDELREQLIERDAHASKGAALPSNATRQADTSNAYTSRYPVSSRLDHLGGLLTNGIITLARANQLLDKFRIAKMPQFPFGLLVYTAWCRYQWKSMHTQMNLVLQLAITLVVDLGLNQQSNFTMRNISAGLQKGRRMGEPKPDHSEVGKRALLGTFYLYSVPSLVRKQLCMRHTDWIRQCGKSFNATPESPSDKLLHDYMDVQLLNRTSAERLKAYVPSQSGYKLKEMNSGLDDEFGLFQDNLYEAGQQRGDNRNVTP
ncbi:hypothetical protein BBP40_003283 [Aspergillus hancockii]|nr:hypothetical protein BBP40_003283 [Aspergillus hancockii]